MMAAVLPVEGEDAVDVRAIVERMQRGEPPADVQEYLWRVRIEAEGIPDVVVADVDPRRFDSQQTANMPSIPELAAVDERLQPSVEWKRELLADFAELRQLIVRWEAIGPPKTEVLRGGELPTVVARTNVPRMSDEDGWGVFFFGKASASDSQEGSDGSENAGRRDGTAPHLRLLLQFDQVLTRRLLEYHAGWLDSVESLSRARAVWVYALLARLDKPVHAEVAATIRQLLRRCWQLRNELGAQWGDGDSARELRLKTLNVLITVTGEFFEQMQHEEQA